MAKSLPWATIETLPSASGEELAAWEQLVDSAGDPEARLHALVGRALATYWAAQTGASPDSWDTLAQRRAADVSEAVELARRGPRHRVDLLATALLGRLAATWGPDAATGRVRDVEELGELLEVLDDTELRLRAREWLVLGRFDAGDLAGARREIAHFVGELSGTREPLFHRRVALWHANLAMLEGRFDEAVRLNQSTISHTADSAGAPFSFQNVAITVAVERYFRRRLDEVIDTIASIRASSPRVGANWEVGLAFALAESGQLDEARDIFDALAIDDFALITRDLNWLVTMVLLAMIAFRLADTDRCATLLEELKPFAHLDATHGFGYCSYGPVGRIVGSLAAACGDLAVAEAEFDRVLRSREPGPWTTMCRLDRAAARSSTDPAGAHADARRAEEEFRQLGLTGWAEDARALWVARSLDGHGPPIALRGPSGGWTLRHPSGRAELADGVGARHLTSLLGRPGRAVGVAELDRSEPTEDPRGPSVMSTLDHAARRAYQRRLTTLDAADRTLDPDEQEERSRLRLELAGGTYTPTVSKELERTRVRVTKALHREIARIAQQSPDLGRHLSESIETGRHCLYAPADGVGWDVVTG